MSGASTWPSISGGGPKSRRCARGGSSQSERRIRYSTEEGRRGGAATTAPGYAIWTDLTRPGRPGQCTVPVEAHWRADSDNRGAARRSARDQGAPAGAADEAAAADADLVAPRAVDARAVPRPPRADVHPQHRLRRHLGDRHRPRGREAGLHRRPEGLPRRRGQPDPQAGARRELGPRPRREAPHEPAQAAAAALPRRPHAGLRGEDDRDRRPRDRELAAGHAPQAAAADAGDDARDHPRDGLRRPRRRADGRAARRPARVPRPDHQPAADRAAGPRRPGPGAAHPGLPPPHRPRRRADPRGDRRAPGAPRTSRSATTSSRCWSPPATRTAAR